MYSTVNFRYNILKTYCIHKIIVEVIKAERASKQMWWSYLFFQLKLKGGVAD